MSNKDDLMVAMSRVDEEVTDSNVPDPDLSKIRMAGSWILVRPVPTQAEKVGSIILATSAQEDVKYLHNVGKVLKVGPRAYKTKDDKVVQYIEGGLALGDFAQWERFVGKKFRYQGVNLVLIRDTDIQFVVDNPLDIDATANLEA